MANHYLEEMHLTNKEFVLPTVVSHRQHQRQSNIALLISKRLLTKNTTHQVASTIKRLSSTYRNDHSKEISIGDYPQFLLVPTSTENHREA